MDILRLRGEIVAIYKTQSAFADCVGWHKNKVSNILTGKYKPDTDDVAIMVDALKMSSDKFSEIFLPRKSPFGDNASKGGHRYDDQAL
jgi:hypothetical protein